MRARVACLLLNFLAATTYPNSLQVLVNGAIAENNSNFVEHLHYSSTVIKLDAFDLNSKTGKAKKGLWAVEFYAPWCPHCKRFAPRWSEVADILSNTEPAFGKDLFVGVVNCVQDRAECTRFGVRGFPAIMTILRSNQTTHYPEGRIKHPNNIARWIRENYASYSGIPIPAPDDTVPRASAKRAAECEWTKMPNKFLSGWAGGVQDKFSLVGAKGKCVQLGAKQCGGITCTKNLRECTVRKASQAFRSLSGEITYSPAPSCFEDEPRAGHQPRANNRPTSQIPGHQSISGHSAGLTKSLVPQVPVSMRDLAATLHFFFQVATPFSTTNSLRGKDLETLKNFIALLVRLLTLKTTEDPTRDQLFRMFDAVVSSPVLTLSEWTLACAQPSPLQLWGYTKHTAKFDVCKGEHHRFPCGLWQLLHVIAARTPDVEALKDLTLAREFILTFFSCSSCQKHFEKATAHPESHVRSQATGMLWLWRIHNDANVRLASEWGHDSEEVLYPSRAACPKCRKFVGPGKWGWEQTNVLHFLRRTYSLSSDLQQQTSVKALTNPLSTTQSVRVTSPRRPSHMRVQKQTDGISASRASAQVDVQTTHASWFLVTSAFLVALALSLWYWTGFGKLFRKLTKKTLKSKV